MFFKKMLSKNFFFYVLCILLCIYIYIKYYIYIIKISSLDFFKYNYMHKVLIIMKINSII